MESTVKSVNKSTHSFSVLSTQVPICLKSILYFLCNFSYTCWTQKKPKNSNSRQGLQLLETCKFAKLCSTVISFICICLIKMVLYMAPKKPTQFVWKTGFLNIFKCKNNMVLIVLGLFQCISHFQRKFWRFRINGSEGIILPDLLP